MRYYIKEIYESGEYQQTASVKARDDIEYILERDNWKKIEIIRARDDADKNVARRVTMHFKAKASWSKTLASLKQNDVLLIQFPVRYHTVFLSSVIRSIRKRGVKVLVIIHDLDMLRYAISPNKTMTKTLRINMEEKSVLNECSGIIVHNNSMKKFLANMGISEKKMISLEIFDYILDENIEGASGEDKDAPVIIAGNLDRKKAEYVYSLPDNVDFNLYGIHYDNTPGGNIKYFGSFPPDELVNVMEGAFGLIWDGPSIDTCQGTYGEYLKINNPHKTSLYLACGIPVAIWKNAALAEFVKKNNCGVLIDSISSIEDIQKNMTDEEYRILRENCRALAVKLRKGDFTKAAISRFLKRYKGKV